MPEIDELERATADVPLTQDARSILERATKLAARRGEEATSATDVLDATLHEPNSLAAREMRALGVDPTSVDAHASANGVVPLRQVVVNANREAQVLGHYRVDSIHLLLAMLYADSPSTAEPLQKAGLTLYDLRNHLQTGAAGPDRQLRRRPWPSLRGVVSVSPVFAGIVATMAVSGALLWNGAIPRLVGLLTIVFVTAAWVTSLCVHEFGHAVVAYLGGDRAVAASGYLTLNPLRYTNVLLSILLPVLFLLLGGIGLPGGAVYINHSALRTRAWSSAVALAGPVGTALCLGLVISPFFTFLTGQDLGFNGAHLAFAGALGFLAFVEVFALVINLIPIPGLDGFAVIRPWLPYRWQVAARTFGMNGIFLVFFVLWVVAPVRSAFYQLIFQLTSNLHVNLFLVVIGQANMRFS